MAQVVERAAWNVYCQTQSSADLDLWRKKLQVLNDEMEHRTRLLAQSVRASGRSGGDR